MRSKSSSNKCNDLDLNLAEENRFLILLFSHLFPFFPLVLVDVFVVAVVAVVL